MSPSTLGALPGTSLNGAVRLDEWGVIRASGDDARTFLNSQLTQEVQSLRPGEARLAGFCSAKGRLQASFVVWSPQPNEVLLACSADLLAPVLKRLSMFVLRAKCKLADASGEVSLWGVVRHADADSTGDRPWTTASHEGRTWIRLPVGFDPQGVPIQRCLMVSDVEHPASEPSAIALDLWRWLEVTSGTARIVAATADHFVPQMINFELVGGVNFQKGCYPGQEIVARSQYRGTLKRRMFLVESPAALQPGQEVFHISDAEQPAGEVVLAASAGGRHVALVELKISATLQGELHAGRPQGALLALNHLPYAVPADQAG